MTTFPASSASELLERVSANLDEVHRRIVLCGKDPASVRIVAVTKTFGVDEVRAAYALGLRDFGENYVDELCAKRTALGETDVTWHFLGALQTNKIVRALGCADVLSGVSRAKELDKMAGVKPGATIDIQVDFTGAAERNGAPPLEVEGLVGRARELNLNVRGLMVVAPPGEERTRAAFGETIALADQLGLKERSMGMSEDLEIALEQGTTELRLGRAIFGPRRPLGALA
ncbi:MAG TPA: YggS family pyridoxal phosphate enzyme [Acidimicrobiales bacterium]|jgi:pyridoxal phosphate enzyme (YggS family)|nr:YggS family pyridoxal phosphate enzyme [Acidimicrobiales bacterium]